MALHSNDNASMAAFQRIGKAHQYMEFPDNAVAAYNNAEILYVDMQAAVDEE